MSQKNVKTQLHQLYETKSELFFCSNVNLGYLTPLQSLIINNIYANNITTDSTKTLNKTIIDHLKQVLVSTKYISSTLLQTIDRRLEDVQQVSFSNDSFKTTSSSKPLVFYLKIDEEYCQVHMFFEMFYCCLKLFGDFSVFSF